MLKIFIPLAMASNMKHSRAWSTTSTVVLVMILPAIFLFPTFHLSSSSPIFYVDSLSAPLIILSMWISALMLLASQKILIEDQEPSSFSTTVMSLLVTLVFAFSMNNLIAFYIIFETSLIPTFLLVFGWGYQPERLQASMYLLLYTITASLPLLLMILMMTSWNNSTFLLMPFMVPSSSNFMTTIWWLFMVLAFMVKMPMYTVHLWLPKAHVEAPVAGSMILAAILLKLGSYALIRVSFLFPAMNQLIKFLFMPIAMLGAVFTSLMCLRQTDLKALIAYSSVGHMGLLIAGTITNMQWGWQGALTLMISHGLTSSALFAMANSIYEVTQTRNLFLTKGLLALFPSITLMLFILSASNMAAPPTINLLAEISLIAPTLATTIQMIIPLILLAFLGGAYSLHLYTAISHGQPSMFSNPHFLITSRNLTIPILHVIPSVMLILKIDTMNPWI